jgi:methylmalonyl-CoA mutase N-terminal domain/subunit
MWHILCRDRDPHDSNAARPHALRRATAIQLVINRDLGPDFGENPWQGSLIVEEN